ncbi:MAG TPA: SlyX family protein [Candidatus Methylomirabilis sp.]|nr:SlyX family protein [Candidatus Methylomirabilis sp.]
MQERLAELEVRLTFQDKTIQELNEVVTRQQRQLDRMARELAMLKAQLQILAPSPAASDAEETPPPHY